MMSKLKNRIPKVVIGILFAATLAACDSSTNPMAPGSNEPGATLPTVVVGRVSIPTQGSGGGAALASGEDLSGVLVTIDGTQAMDTTDAAGTFRVEATSSGDKMVLRFRRGGLDAKLEIEGVRPGVLISVEVTLSGGIVSLSDSSRGDRNEFEGIASFVSVTGAAGARTARVGIADSIGTVQVDLVEGATVFDNEGDFTSFGDVLAALQRGTALEIEGEGLRQADGSITAKNAKVETDD